MVSGGTIQLYSKFCCLVYSVIYGINSSIFYGIIDSGLYDIFYDRLYNIINKVRMRGLRVLGRNTVVVHWGITKDSTAASREHA